MSSNFHLIHSLYEKSFDQTNTSCLPVLGTKDRRCHSSSLIPFSNKKNHNKIHLTEKSFFVIKPATNHKNLDHWEQKESCDLDNIDKWHTVMSFHHDYDYTQDKNELARLSSSCRRYAACFPLISVVIAWISFIESPMWIIYKTVKKEHIHLRSLAAHYLQNSDHPLDVKN